MDSIAKRFRDTLDVFNISENLEEIVDKLVLNVVEWQQEVKAQQDLTDPS